MSVIVREKVRGSGVYWIFVTSRGLRTARKVGSRQAAEKAARQIEAKIALGQFGNQDKEVQDIPTVKIYSDIWMSTCIEGILDDMTHERYGYVLRRDIIPVLGTKTLNRVGAKEVRDLLNSLRKAGRTAKSVSLTRTVLSSLLSEAVIEEWIEKNPVAELRVGRKRSKTADARRPKQHKVDPFTKKEVSIFLDYVMSRSPDDYGPMFFCDLRAGLRLGELLGLHWSDILWSRKLIYVRRSFKRQKVKPLKTGTERYVDMSDQLHAVLADLLLRKERAATQDGTGEVPPIIFANSSGRYRAQNSVRKMFKKFLKGAGLREIRIHDMRHTFAALLLAKGASLSYLKAQLGHASIKTTGDTYGHLVPGELRNFVNCLDTESPSSVKGNEQNKKGEGHDD